VARRAIVILSVVALAGALSPAAALADHTDPGSPLVPTSEEGNPGGGVPHGGGEWDFVANFPPNLGSDLWTFQKDGATYAASGSLGQLPNTVGQRITQLIDADGEIAPRWIADHGSAHPTLGGCLPATGATGLQHDPSVSPFTDPELLFDSTDATGRCHDPDGGGIEIVDISDLDEVREIHLTRHAMTTHTLTVDPDRQHLVFSNNSSFSNGNWLEFLDVRSCLTRDAGGDLDPNASLEDKRADCQPDVYRIPFEDEWTQQTTDGESEPAGPGRGCHDIVIVDGIVFCSGITGEVLLDIRGITDAAGDVRGQKLDCETGIEPDRADTGALVTDCSMWNKAAYEADGSPQAAGWQYLGHYNHPGITEGNTNTQVPSTEGVAVSHETRPLPAGLDPNDPDRRFMVVSDERGGAVVPGGANCIQEDFDEFWHGGLHFFDVTDPSNIEYATAVDGDGNEMRAVWRGQIHEPRPTFCVVHRFEQVPGEQRIVMAYYSQGTKILDYEIDDQGRFVFEEVASFIPKLPVAEANTWAANVFKVEDTGEVDEATGRAIRTYHIMTSDIARGIDVMTWTGPSGVVNESDPLPPGRPGPGDPGGPGGPGGPGDPGDRAVSCPDPVPPHPYTDRDRIPPVHVDNVDCATFRDIVAGFRDGSYGPRLPVRRDQMASFIARMIDTAEGARPLPDADESGDRFRDIDGNTHEDNIKRLHAAGIIAGRSETSYAPGQVVRRDQVASFVLRAAAYATGVAFEDVESDDRAFPDVGPDNVHFERVNGAAEMGLVAGRTDGRFHPANSTERAQMASVVVRSLIHIERAGAGGGAAGASDAGAVGSSPGNGPLAAAAAQVDLMSEEGLALLLLVLLPAVVLSARRQRVRVATE
jgi:hypothetical protein